MNQKQLERVRGGKGFLAALDQSGGSTPKALAAYGIPRTAYINETEMFDLVHQMRTRVITSPAFSSEHILGAILFEQTMDRTVEGLHTGDYLWQKKGVVPFLKVDKGLAPLEEGVQLMKPMPGLNEMLKRASERNIFGTKMRSVIHKADPDGIRKIVDQQFQFGIQIAKAGFLPILEPEVDIFSPDKQESEKMLKADILSRLNRLPEDIRVMLKLSIPTLDNFYEDLIAHPKVVRVVALSGGYSRQEADERLRKNHGLIASFSRALLNGLNVNQRAEEFQKTLADSIEEIYQASVT